MKKPAIVAFDFIRMLSTLGILAFHFSCHLADTSFLPFYGYANGDWGGMLVTVFFMLSGASLYYHYANHLTVSTLRTYFYKRWLSIFPMYYLAFTGFEAMRILSAKNLFFRGNPLIYVYTLLGMDGYLANVLPTAHNCGEWFTGAIILLYILFPLILFCYEKHAAFTGVAIAALYVLTFDIPIINRAAYCSIPSCLISFFLGMVFMKHRRWFDRPLCAGLCALLSLLLCFVKLPFLGNANISNHLTGIFSFIMLYAIGNLVMRFAIPRRLITGVSRISYGIFLSHHIIILVVFTIFQPSGIAQVLSLLIADICLILVASKILTMITNIIMRYLEPALRKRVFPS